MAIDDDDTIKGLLSVWGLAGKPCDSCHTSSSLLFCHRHSAYLCSPCDADIHRENPHERVWVCEVCEQAPAAFTCKADAAALCVSCDRDIHSANPLSQRHQRIPIVPFLHTPAANSIPSDCSGSFLVPTDDDLLISANGINTIRQDNHQLINTTPPPPPLIYPSHQHHHRHRHHHHHNHLEIGFQQQQPEIIKQKFPNTTTTNCFEIDFTQSKLSPFNYSSSICQTHSVSSSEVGVVPDGTSNSMSEVSNFPFHKSIEGTSSSSLIIDPPQQLTRAERQARVMRYRQKRKNRKFEKTIRYASRKAYAESRPRIKGRFAKRNNNHPDDDIDDDMDFLSIMDHAGYGVVPSF